MQDSIANAVVAVAGIDIDLPRCRAGPEAVHFEVLVTPLGGDSTNVAPEIIPRAGMGHVQAGAAPFGFVGRGVRVFDEPILMFAEEGIVISAGERHEPQAGNQSQRFDLVGGAFHSRRIRTVGGVRGKVSMWSVGRDARLPMIVNLDYGEPEWRELFGGKSGEFGEMFFIRSAAVGP